MLVFLFLALCAIAAPAPAQPTEAPLRERAEQLVALLNGEAEPASMFTEAFLRAVPPTQVQALTEQLRGQYGQATAIATFEPASATAAAVQIEMERALVRAQLTIEPQPPHRIAGLRIIEAAVKNDSLAAITEELSTLRGETSLAVARLGDSAPEMLASHRVDEPMAIGSTFKLFILAELNRQIDAGERRWSDVVALDRRSLPSGMLQDWPQGSPLTLHTLAALMISISDNTAADTLLHVLGREKVERLMATLGIGAAARNRPLLSTRQAFALKAAPEATFQAWRQADEAERRRLLEDLELGELDPQRLGTAPTRIDSAEWFASAADLVRVMDWLRRHGDAQTLAILAINPGMSAPAAQAFGYVGYKGGSEPGVLNLTWLIRNQAGQWYALSGSWNNDEAALDDSRFAALMRRAARLLR